MKCSYCQQVITENLSLLELIFPQPRRCYLCQEKFALITHRTACPGCGKTNQTGLCLDCQKWLETYPALLENRGLFQYDTAFKAWIEKYKFKGDYRLSATFVPEIRQALREYPDYLVCPLPLSEERFKLRGFNQVTAFLQASQISFEELLTRKKDLPPQSKKTRLERLKMEQPFCLAVSPAKIKNKRVLLVDDVYTTGRTLFHGAQILWENEVRCVKSLTLAR